MAGHRCWHHVPVLKQELLSWLNPVAGGVYVDATLGLGGHAEALLIENHDIKRVYGFEWDEDAAEIAAERLQPFGKQFQLVHSSYSQIKTELKLRGVDRIDGLLADLGVSSLHLDKGERGFSFQKDGPLDMRMNRQRSIRAKDLVEQLAEQELADIFYHFGEERQARRIARHLVEQRKKEPILTTKQLADIVAEAVPGRYYPKKIHVATKVFQALRIAVNDEFGNMKKLLTDVPDILVSEGRACIVSFHSLEDRMIKQLFKNYREYRPLTAKPIQASAQEVAQNPRARSARLRIAERI
ncbi:MAG: 16S rRNA (cytosine(1402)-N(4))-methyltransferase [Desulfobulbus propionicus]|nr:MAG: 16S rRNA (cytosine(1402)-N(4))-methyltransferase [Desulfobulbus propionicus]